MRIQAFIIVLTLLISLGIGCGTSENPAPKKTALALDKKYQKFEELSKKKLNVGILIMNGVYNTELTAPMDIFHHTVYHSDSGMNVFTIGNTMERITTFEGLKIHADYDYTEDNIPQIDILVVPSAEHHLDTDLEDSVMISFVRETGKNADFIVSLCDGAFVLAQAGLLTDRKCTTFPGDIGKFRERFPDLDIKEDILWVHDQNAITSAGGAKSFEPALYLCHLLYGEKATKGIAKGMVLDWELEKQKGLIY